jgi:hypothetical protein
MIFNRRFLNFCKGKFEQECVLPHKEVFVFQENASIDAFSVLFFCEKRLESKLIFVTKMDIESCLYTSKESLKIIIMHYISLNIIK